MPGSWVLKYDGECRPVHKCDGYSLAAARCWPFIVYTRPLAIPPPFLPCPIPHHPYHLCVGGGFAHPLDVARPFRASVVDGNVQGIPQSWRGCQRLRFGSASVVGLLDLHH